MKKKFKPPYDRFRGELNPNEYVTGKSINTRYTKGNPNPAVTTTNLSIRIPVQTGDFMRDRVTPGYREKSAKGEIIISPMSSVHNEVDYQAFTGEYYRSYVKDVASATSGSTILNIFEYQNAMIDFSSQYWRSLDKDAQTYLRSKAINEAYTAAKQRNVMGFVDLAEMDQTVDLVRTNLGRMENLLRYGRLRKLPHVNKRQSLKEKRLVWKAKSVDGKIAEASNLWLEAHYGIIPTMLTIEGLIKTFSKQVRPVRQTYRGFAGDSGVYNNVEKVPVAGVITGTTIGDIIYRTRIDYRRSARAGVISDYKASTRAQLGVELSDLPSSFYELIPYSFVLDWAYDIGGYLSAVQPVQGFHTLGSFVTDVIEKITLYEYTYPSAIQDYYPSTYKYQARWTGFQAYYRSIERTRVRLTNVTPQPPVWDKAAVRSLTHFVSALALGFSRLKGGLKQSHIRK